MDFWRKRMSFRFYVTLRLLSLSSPIEESCTSFAVALGILKLTQPNISLISCFAPFLLHYFRPRGLLCRFCECFWGLYPSLRPRFVRSATGNHQKKIISIFVFTFLHLSLSFPIFTFLCFSLRSHYISFHSFKSILSPLSL